MSFRELLLCLALCTSALPCAAENPLQLAQRRACLSCHAPDSALIGPSFAEIAARYANRPEAFESLVRSVRLGSFKRCDDTPMPGDKAPEKDVREIVRWILTVGDN